MCHSPGYRDYRRREFCNAVMCPVQQKLNGLEKGSEDYEKARTWRIMGNCPGESVLVMGAGESMKVIIRPNG